DAAILSMVTVTLTADAAFFATETAMLNPATAAGFAALGAAQALAIVGALFRGIRIQLPPRGGWLLGFDIVTVHVLPVMLPVGAPRPAPRIDPRRICAVRRRRAACRRDAARVGCGVRAGGLARDQSLANHSGMVGRSGSGAVAEGAEPRRAAAVGRLLAARGP